MNKDYDTWNKKKKFTESNFTQKHIYSGEIWWCSLGVNIGAEIDGKNESFERPVVVLRVYNRETLLVLPLTTKEKIDKFHYKVETKNKIGWAKLTQARVVSHKRMLRKIDTVESLDFGGLKSAFVGLL